MDKKERLNAAYEHLRHIDAIRTQKDVAEKMSSTSQNVSQALQGNPKVLTDRFLMRFLTAFPDIFSMQWLFTGDGSMLINDSAPAQAQAQPTRSYQLPDDAPVMAAEAAPPQIATSSLPPTPLSSVLPIPSVTTSPAPNPASAN